MIEFNYNGIILKEGDILLSHTYFHWNLDSFPAPFVRMVTKCFYNHASVIGNCMNKLYVFEAIGRGFIPSKPLEEWLEETGKVREFIVLNSDNVSYQEVYNSINDLVGNKYNFTELGFTYLLYYKTGIWTGITKADTNTRLVCSQVVAKGYEKIFPDWFKLATINIYLCNKLKIVYESNINLRKKYYVCNKNYLTRV